MGVWSSINAHMKAHLNPKTINSSALPSQLTALCVSAGRLFPAGHSILAPARECYGVSIQHWWQQCSSEVGARLLCLAAFVESGKHGHVLLDDADTSRICLHAFQH